MTYNSILTVLTDKPTGHDCLEHAIALARDADAHLEVLALGMDPVQMGYAYGGASALIQAATLEDLGREVADIADLARDRLDKSGLRFSVEHAVALPSGAHALIGNHARFADVLVLPRPYEDGASADTETLLESALFSSGTPVIVVPNGVKAPAKPKRIVVGWNESAQSLAAIKAAMPLLRGADLVSLTIIDPPTHGPDRSDPGGAVSQFMARHGVHVEISVLSKTMPRVGDVLMRHASDFGADLIVTGAYGHTRFREALLGGATRRLLQHSDIPLLMMH